MTCGKHCSVISNFVNATDSKAGKETVFRGEHIQTNRSKCRLYSDQKLEAEALGDFFEDLRKADCTQGRKKNKKRHLGFGVGFATWNRSSKEEFASRSSAAASLV